MASKLDLKGSCFLPSSTTDPLQLWARNLGSKSLGQKQQFFKQKPLTNSQQMNPALTLQTNNCWQATGNAMGTTCRETSWRVPTNVFLFQNTINSYTPNPHHIAHLLEVVSNLKLVGCECVHVFVCCGCRCHFCP